MGTQGRIDAFAEGFKEGRAAGIAYERERNKWEPIETHDKTSRRSVLVYEPTYQNIFAVTWDAVVGKYRIFGSTESIRCPSHWQPLPRAPQ